MVVLVQLYPAWCGRWRRCPGPNHLVIKAAEAKVRKGVSLKASARGHALWKLQATAGPASRRLLPYCPLAPPTPCLSNLSGCQGRNCERRSITYCARCSGVGARVRAGAGRAQALMAQLPAVVVAGIPSISRAVMNRAKGGELQLFAEGFDFRVRHLAGR